ncbi:MAG: hypothetical protein GIKADHBN_01421 [Phycisphaerales bacterium]|nr:hypothetical protein [Phycisphaerales bacterium]
MPITGNSYNFTKQNVDLSPDSPGVYALIQNGTIIYYGRATISIRSRLQSHYRGTEGPCTQAATEYMREECTNPVTREVELLAEYQRINGRLPRCNERVG